MKKSDLLKRLANLDSLDIRIWPRKPGVYRLVIEIPGTLETNFKNDPILVSPDDLTREEAEAIYKTVFEQKWSESMRMHTEDK